MEYMKPLAGPLAHEAAAELPVEVEQATYRQAKVR